MIAFRSEEKYWFHKNNKYGQMTMDWLSIESRTQGLLSVTHLW